MRKVLFGLSIFVLVVSLLAVGFFYWRIKPLGFGAFPAVVHHLAMIEGPGYRANGDSYLYGAVYGTPDDNFIHTIEVMPSAEEAAADLRRRRESLTTNRAASTAAPIFTRADSEKDNVLAYEQGSRAETIWAEGNRIYTIVGYNANTVNEVALQLRGLPGEDYNTLGRMLGDLPARLLHWAGVLVPAVFAAGALFVMLLTFVVGRRRKTAMA